MKNIFKKNATARKQGKKAFTIVELVIVIAVIAILMGILFIGGTAISNNAKVSTLGSDLRSYEVNLKAMVNDPNNTNLLTTKKPGGVDKTNIETQLDAYLEDDLKLDDTGLVLVDACGHSGVSREYLEGKSAQLDPYGMPYNVVVMDNSDMEHTDIILMVYSFGKNKQSASTTAGEEVKYEGKFDEDDVARVVRIYDSVIYTTDIGPAMGNYTVESDTVYLEAVNEAFTGSACVHANTEPAA